jgi:hypothetical protein
MANSNDPAVSTGITTEKPLTPVASHSEPANTAAPAIMARRLFRYDMVLLALVLVLAFFLGSFVASNTEVFLHLGLGSPWGSEEDRSVVHHAWLPSLVLQTIYQPFTDTAKLGGEMAVVLKALVVVLIAFVLCLIHRRGEGWLLPVVCTGLAVLVMSPRLLLQPVVLSLLFLAITFFILNLPSASNPRAIWWLPLLFALWVNADSWFVLGPITLALVLVGEWLQRRLRWPAASDVPAAPDRLKQLGIVMLVGLAACLVNPWTYRAFTLPMELGYVSAKTGDLIPGYVAKAGRAIHKVRDADPQFFSQQSPLGSDYWSRTTAGKNVAGLAYFVLLLLGVASFVAPAYFLERSNKLSPANSRARAGFTLPLFAVFLFFGLLSMLTSRLIPLFAVVAGPIAVLNFQDFQSRRFAAPGATSLDLNRALGIRAIAVLVFLVLVICAWPGWLHALPDDWRFSHHVGWGVVEDPGVPKAAATISRIQEFGRANHQPDLMKLGLNVNVEGGNSFAWSAHHGTPGVKLIWDTRFDVDPASAEAIGKIRKALRDEVEAAMPPYDLKKMDFARSVYQESLRKLGVDYIVITNLQREGPPLPFTNLLVAQNLLRDTHQWPLLYQDGRTAIFGWQDPLKHENPFAKVRLDMSPLAPLPTFPPNVPTVILEAGVPPVPTEPVSDWDLFLTGPVAPSLSSFESAAYASSTNAIMQHAQATFHGLMADAGGALALAAKGKVATYDLGRDAGPPGGPVLSVRSARNGVLESPLHAFSYAQLADVCEFAFNQEERWVNRPQVAVEPYKSASMRHRFRQVEILTALQRAALLQPATWQFHKRLGDWYYKLNFADVALDQWMLARNHIDPKELPLQKFAEEIKHRQDDFKAAVAGQTEAFAQFQKALIMENPDPKDLQGRDKVMPRGLVQLAFRICAEAKFDQQSDANAAGAMLEWRIYLMLMMGQADEVRKADSTLSRHLPPGEFEELQAMAAVALGDYAASDKLLAEAEKVRELPPDQELKAADEKALAYFRSTAQWTVSALPGEDGIAGFSARLGTSLLQQQDTLKELGNKLVQRSRVAELRLMRGLLAVEQGQLAKAYEHFEGCVRIVPVIAIFPDLAIAKRYLQILPVGGKQ